MSEKNSPPEPRELGEVLQMKPFQVSALAGLALVGYMQWTDSAFEWVVTFAYFLVGLPALWSYFRLRPGDDRTPAIPQELLDEMQAYQELRARLTRRLTLTGIDPTLAERALKQYDTALRVFERLPDQRSGQLTGKTRKLANGAFRAVMENLGGTADLLTQLASIDTQQVLKKIQNHAGRTLNERDMADLNSAKAKAGEREKMLSEIIDRLQANERHIGNLSALARSQPKRDST